MMDKMFGFNILLLVMLFMVFRCNALALVGRLQSTGVQGKLLCNGKPLKNVVIKLYDNDRGLDTDDLLAKGKTDSNGEFKISGYTREVTPIDPKLNIYHDCEDILPCQRKLTIKIRDSYISSSETPKQYYDAGTLELSGKFKGESRDCIH